MPCFMSGRVTLSLNSCHIKHMIKTTAKCKHLPTFKEHVNRQVVCTAQGYGFRQEVNWTNKNPTLAHVEQSKAIFLLRYLTKSKLHQNSEEGMVRNNNTLAINLKHHINHPSKPNLIFIFMLCDLQERPCIHIFISSVFQVHFLC